jgi:hypothetical protein
MAAKSVEKGMLASQHSATIQRGILADGSHGVDHGPFRAVPPGSWFQSRLAEQPNRSRRTASAKMQDVGRVPVAVKAKRGILRGTRTEG